MASAAAAPAAESAQPRRGPRAAYLWRRVCTLCAASTTRWPAGRGIGLLTFPSTKAASWSVMCSESVSIGLAERDRGGGERERSSPPGERPRRGDREGERSREGERLRGWRGESRVRLDEGAGKNKAEAADATDANDAVIKQQRSSLHKRRRQRACHPSLLAAAKEWHPFFSLFFSLFFFWS